MSEILKAEERSLARSLKVLAPLIKEEIEAGTEAAERAGLEHYRIAGEMLLEAKSQLQHGAWQEWFKRQRFGWGLTQARRYMALAEATAKTPRREFLGTSIKEAVGEIEHPRTAAPWVQPVREVVQRVNTSALAREAEGRAKEQKLLRDLGFQLIDIGFKVLAAKLHPDKPGGSSEAMSRLNKVRTVLKGAL